MSKDSTWKREARDRAKLRKLSKDYSGKNTGATMMLLPIEVLATMLEEERQKARSETWAELCKDNQKVYHVDSFYLITKVEP